MSKFFIDGTGNRLSKTSASDLEFVIQEYLKIPTKSTEIDQLRSSSQKADEPYTLDEALC